MTPKEKIEVSLLEYDLSSFMKSEGHIPEDIHYSNQKLGLALTVANGRIQSFTYFSKELNDQISISSIPQRK